MEPVKSIVLYWLFQIYEPGCSLAAGGQYNPRTGFCEPSTSRTLSISRGYGTKFQCDVMNFNNIEQDCFEEDCSGTNGRCSGSPGNIDIQLES